MELQDAGIELPNLVVFKDVDWKMLECCCERGAVAINSNGELLVGCNVFNSCDVIFQKFTMNKVKAGKISGNGIKSRHVFLLAVDSNDNTYVLTDVECCPSTQVLIESTGRRYVTARMSPSACDLTAVDSKNLLLLRKKVGYCPGQNILVPTPDGIALMTYNAYVSDRTEVAFYKNEKGNVQQTSSFETKLWESPLITVTNKYQVVAVEKDGYRVRVYEKDGQLIREFELCGGKDESCVRIAFNFLTEELVVVSRVGSWYFLSTYKPKTGERRHNVRLTLFGKVKEKTYLHLTTHCSGPMALVSREYVLYLQ
jgi:hypothetical protein